MTSPQGYWGGPRADALEASVRQIQEELKSLRERGNRDLGALSIKAPNGNTTFESGPNTLALMSDGTPQWITVIRDTTGASRLTFWDPNPSVDGFIQALYMFDHLGQIVWTTDNNGGWAEPWFGIPMYQQFPVVTGNQYAAVNVAENRMWYGRIPYVSHPQLGVSGIWGPRTGTNTTRYRLKVWGVTVATWDVGGAVDDDRGPFNIASLVNDKQAPIEITAQTLSGTGEFYCQVASVHLRQT